MGWSETLTDDAIAIMIIICVIPTLCYIAIKNNNPDLVYAVVGIVMGFYFGKK